MIQDYKKEGKIVPSEVTVKLLQQAMQGSTNNKFLIDGFPCNEENRTAFENIVGQICCCLYYCLSWVYFLIWKSHPISW